MRVRLQGTLANYELRLWSEREPNDELEYFVDEHDALRLLQPLVDDGQAIELRALVEEAGLSYGGLERDGWGLLGLDDDALVRRVAAALVHGSLIAVRMPYVPMVSHEAIQEEVAPELHEPEEFEMESVRMTPQADSEWIGLSVTAVPEVLEFETSHSAP
ncbi:hypothetical protein G6O69_07470 [Pseudenhygromyxa sp. WMMC2535]|uniref:hypothetical protein n=1 Tax=Pseudenhygromyxa sp. WMMC2535 TaxID=2712867 RepID=UPI0015554476|nr:hypothetical protein [Pseudenhygromyxa sp. WMMC2535]NVB37667.1 hypothetical protein [Pseudenhygromyxa sp. WMMC2535]